MDDPRLDTTLATFEHERIAIAMRSLPARWRTVLWHAEVLGQMPRDIAPILGIEANAVSALLFRARKGLRRAHHEMTTHTNHNYGPTTGDVGRLGTGFTTWGGTQDA